MKARITGFRRSRSRAYNNYCIIESKEGNLAGLIGKRVVWKKDAARPVSGRILRVHGKRAVLGRFDRGLPGIAIGSEVQIGRPGVKAEKKVKQPKTKSVAKVKKSKPKTAKKSVKRPKVKKKTTKKGPKAKSK